MKIANNLLTTGIFCFLKGFYWDITDWNGGIAAIDPNSMQQLDKHETINTNMEQITTPTNENCGKSPFVETIASVSLIGDQQARLTTGQIQNSTFNDQSQTKQDDYSSMYSKVYRGKFATLTDH